MPRRARRPGAFLALLAGALGIMPASGQAQGYKAGPVTFAGSARDRLVVGAGVNSPVFSPDDTTAGAVALGYRFGHKLWVLGPSLSVLGGADLALHVGAGIYTDIEIGPVVITPEVQAGYYNQGDGGTDLGSPFAFQSLIEVAWEIPSGGRFGLRLSHLSNAGLYEDNPGTETILAIASFPVF